MVGESGLHAQPVKTLLVIRSYSIPNFFVHINGLLNYIILYISEQSLILRSLKDNKKKMYYIRFYSHKIILLKFCIGTALHSTIHAKVP